MNVQEIMQFGGSTALVTVMALGGVIAASWRQLRTVFQYTSGLLVSRMTIDTTGSFALGAYIRTHYRRLPGGQTRCQTQIVGVPGSPVDLWVPFETVHGPSVWIGPRGVFIIQSHQGGAQIKTIKGMSIKGLVGDSLLWHQRQRERQTSNFYIYRVIGEDRRSIGGLHRNTPASPSGDSGLRAGGQEQESSWNHVQPMVDQSWLYPKERYKFNLEDPGQGLFWPTEVNQLLEHLRGWHRRGQWYADRDIPWRTGVLLYGPTGGGKSQFIRVTAETLRIPLYQFYLSTLTDQEFIERWRELPTPCVVALEDFDSIFHGRENITPDQVLSFDVVLNQISGAGAVNGVLLFVTTNHIEHVDPAIGRLDCAGRPTRPGRIDHVLEFGLTTEETRRQIAEFVLKDESLEVIDRLVEDYSGTTPAQFQNHCVQWALKRLQDHDKI